MKRSILEILDEKLAQSVAPFSKKSAEVCDGRDEDGEFELPVARGIDVIEQPWLKLEVDLISRKSLDHDKAKRDIENQLRRWVEGEDRPPAYGSVLPILLNLAGVESLSFVQDNEENPSAQISRHAPV